jgi:hypothetical protein
LNASHVADLWEALDYAVKEFRRNPCHDTREELGRIFKELSREMHEALL